MYFFFTIINSYSTLFNHFGLMLINDYGFCEMGILISFLTTLWRKILLNQKFVEHFINVIICNIVT